MAASGRLVRSISLSFIDEMHLQCLPTNRSIFDCIEVCTLSLATVEMVGSITTFIASSIVSMATGSRTISAGELGLGIMCSCPLRM